MIDTRTIRKLGYGFLFAFRSNYGSISSEIKRYIDRKSYILYPLYSTPPLWGHPSEYCHTFWYRKTRMAWLPDGEKVLTTFSRFDRIPACDRRTDRHLATTYSPRYAQHRAGNRSQLYNLLDPRGWRTMPPSGLQI